MEPEGGWSELEILGDHGVSLQGTSSFTTQDLMRPLVRRRLKHERKFAHSLVGTPNYIAPEVLARSGKLTFVTLNLLVCLNIMAS